MFEDKSNPEDNLTDLEWLVENRSINQRSTLKLYRIIINNRTKLGNDQWRRSAMQKLLGVAFSLWRAVFLADIEQKRGSMMKDVEGFALELIQTNAITFGFDRQKKDWTFRYYLQNATDRLNRLHSDFGKKERSFTLPGSSRGKSPQDRWIEHQTALDEAIEAFESILSGKKVPSEQKAAKVRRTRRGSKSQPEISN